MIRFQYGLHWHSIIIIIIIIVGLVVVVAVVVLFLFGAAGSPGIVSTWCHSSLAFQVRLG